MSLLTADCSASGILPDVPDFDCHFSVKQVQKIIIQRRYSTGTTLNQIAANDADVEATWTTLLAETDETKMQITPKLHAPTFEPGGPIEFGSGDDVADGIPFVTGENPTKATFILRNCPPKIVKALREYDATEPLMVFFVTNEDVIIANSDDGTTPTQVYGFFIESWFCGSRKPGNISGTDENLIQFNLKEGWDENMIKVVPDGWSPLTVLAN